MAGPISAEVLRALSHPLRLAILVVLEQGELEPADLAGRVGASGAELGRHLAALQAAGLVREGELPGRLRTSTGGWAAVDRQLRALGGDGSEPPQRPR